MVTVVQTANWIRAMVSLARENMYKLPKIGVGHFWFFSQFLVLGPDWHLFNEFLFRR